MDFVEEQSDLRPNDLTAFFYQFTSKAEFISEGKKVILMNKVSFVLDGQKKKKKIVIINF